ncbi:hypothetical protein [Rhodoligotrophos defluvii]|uniref:hypothetical protein n=1 Tax=Rhodoligotrophos defluvii TaxID=2561934 RepID=UPI0010C959A2|nr:hypothetical protein [Rhodoligotrophos defluvii]
MDWFAPVDLYCERLAPGLWAEPLNVLSNLAFFIAAVLAARHAWQGVNARNDGFLWLLIILVAVIGAGSTAFHLVGTRWAMLADVVPITLFIYMFFLFAMRRFLGLDWPAALLTTALFFGASWIFGESLPRGFMNGSGSYLPAFFAMAGVGALLIHRDHPAGHWFAGAGGVFLISLTFRTIDQAICPILPIGVHYMWHILNSLVLYLLLEAGVRWGRAKASAS